MPTNTYSVQSKKSGNTYFLHCRQQTLNGGKTVTLYYFAREAKDNAVDALPDGYEVTESSRTGLPMLRKKR